MDGEDLASAGGPSEHIATGIDAAAPWAEEFGHCREGCEALARAISTTLGSVMREFDARAEGAARSQDHLLLSFDRLTGELDKLVEDAPMPFIMQHAVKISSIRKRVSSLNLLLKSIQRRIDNIDRMLSTGIPNDNVSPDIVETSALTL
ncbi:uncharacterized protein LOC103724383 [Phoenix dactylifera]|uniref:Biogenesis of lysosome-related organelles complex 1 subunit 7 n=1 Tax=Phoenix dactylifera TaxID=42345 RepID=A0A8B7D5T4_PHODC|nr:uncharacterized protein LOC103724383 [Phoenix dactylifera]